MSPPTAPFSPTINLALSQQAVSILSSNGQAVGALPIIEGAAGYATSAGIQAISQMPQVAQIDQDAVVRARRPANSGTSWAAGNLTSLYPQEVNATSVWQQSGYGYGYSQGVTVAVLDSGVASDVDLTDNQNRVVARVSFAGPMDPQHPDPGGHGTHIAGTIAGDGTRSNGEYVGMDPHANVASVQVLDYKGNGRVSSVLRGLSWVLGHKRDLNIKVVNMSLGTPPVGAYRTDPLAAGVEVAWKNGITVVAAAGNQGSGKVESPGIDPYVITVGSTDDAGTVTLNDDTLAWFSSWGTPTASTQKPDMVAPGRKIVSIRVPGSTLDTTLPDHVVTAKNGSKYMRLSGTSMSTGIVSGAVALLLERNPNLTPDQVKHIMVMTTQRFGQNASPPPAGAAGSGLLNCYTAYSSTDRASADRGLRLGDGVARMVYSLIYGGPLSWKDPNYQGINWTAFTWATLPWTTAAWDNIAWDNIAWDNIAWDNIAWDQTSWDNIAWDNIAWDSSEWSNIAWDSFAFD
ncbi:MAG: hypothetical protein E6I52_14790 [Chloroflexi bacterium]|nr:MAG: hypothetical protein E6I52_14790 [Chloroflexota bacterium]